DPVEILIDFVLGILDVIGLDISARVSLVFATTDPGQILAQEIAHNMGYVNPYSQNHDTWNISHSRFDEDRPDLTFFDAPLAGDEAINVVPPGMIFQRGGTLAKSVMSYAPGMTDTNAFLEPRDYNSIVLTAWARFSQSDLAPRSQPRIAEGPKVRIVGSVAIPSLEARIQEIRPAPEASDETVHGGSPLVLAFVDAGGAVLSESSFPVTLHLPIHKHPQAEDGDHEHEHVNRHGDGGAHHGPNVEEPVEHALLSFHVVRLVPEGAAGFELRYRDEVIWTRSVGESSPEIAIVSPTGGEARA